LSTLQLIVLWYGCLILAAVLGVWSVSAESFAPAVAAVVILTALAVFTLKRRSSARRWLVALALLGPPVLAISVMAYRDWQATHAIPIGEIELSDVQWRIDPNIPGMGTLSGIAINHSARTLVGLRIEIGEYERVFAGKTAEFTLAPVAPGDSREFTAGTTTQPSVDARIEVDILERRLSLAERLRHPVPIPPGATIGTCDWCCASFASYISVPPPPPPRGKLPTDDETRTYRNWATSPRVFRLVGTRAGD
jgi:hypothetical protein